MTLVTSPLRGISSTLSSLPKGAVITGTVCAALSYKVSARATRQFSGFNKTLYGKNPQLSFKQKCFVALVLPPLVSAIFSGAARFILRAGILKTHFVGILALSVTAGFIACVQNLPTPPEKPPESSEDDLDGALPSRSGGECDGPMEDSPQHQATLDHAPVAHREQSPQAPAVTRLLNEVREDIEAVGKSIRARNAAPKDKRAALQAVVSEKKGVANAAYMHMQDTIEGVYKEGTFPVDLARVLVYPRFMRALLTLFWDIPEQLERFIILLEHDTACHNVSRLMHHTLVQSFWNLSRKEGLPQAEEEKFHDFKLLVEVAGQGLKEGEIDLFPAGNLDPFELLQASCNDLTGQRILELLKEKGIRNPTLEMTLGELIPILERMLEQIKAMPPTQPMQDSGLDIESTLTELEKRLTEADPQIAQLFSEISAQVGANPEQRAPDSITDPLDAARKQFSPDMKLKDLIDQLAAQGNPTLPPFFVNILSVQFKAYISEMQLQNDPNKFIQSKNELFLTYLTPDEHAAFIAAFGDSETFKEFVEFICLKSEMAAFRSSMRPILGSDSEQKEKYIRSLKSALALLRHETSKAFLTSEGNLGDFISADDWALKMYERLANDYQTESPLDEAVS